LRISPSFPTLPPDMIKIELTPQQFNQLYELLVIGMKAGNVQNMKVGLPLVEILETAAAQHKPE